MTLGSSTDAIFVPFVNTNENGLKLATRQTVRPLLQKLIERATANFLNWKDDNGSVTIAMSSYRLSLFTGIIASVKAGMQTELILVK